ncbi:hypothetical protein QAD02_007321 [Eretmocerus hayati]|uniref:Uncharacterized protein n=2 Tax=Eretmocerus hayati TaxID=131215 RepID=A0ACC2N3D2_9HYME|nr:hypothetical protein QAD02_007319 [Eretmocerus hayati]KAJ8665659.1 hypothetical protein QAD02_007321 [Eretmocerus hayati]
MLYPLVESCLPEELLRAWQRTSVYSVTSAVNADSSENRNVVAKNRLEQLIKFLSSEVQIEVRISMAVKGFDLKPDGSDSDDELSIKRTDTKDIPSAVGLLTTKGKISPCIFCESSDHISQDCVKAKKM